MIDASRDGDCGACTERIRKGDRIGLFDGEWCHEECIASLGFEDEYKPQKMTTTNGSKTWFQKQMGL